MIELVFAGGHAGPYDESDRSPLGVPFFASCGASFSLMFYRERSADRPQHAFLTKEQARAASTGSPEVRYFEDINKTVYMPKWEDPEGATATLCRSCACCNFHCTCDNIGRDNIGRQRSHQ